MTQKYIIANWKCNKTIAESLAWVDQVGPAINSEQYIVIVCPSFVSLSAVKDRIAAQGYKLKVGAQNVSQFESGAYTGEVSAAMLVDTVDYALVGHSERRTHFSETNDDVAKKAELCFKYSISPVVLVRDEKDSLPEQVKIFAWEPVFAIGTGNAVKAEDAEIEIAKLKGSRGIAGLYGGSVSVDNIKSFMDQPSIDGVLIGSASWTAETFVEMIHALH